MTTEVEITDDQIHETMFNQALDLIKDEKFHLIYVDYRDSFDENLGTLSAILFGNKDEQRDAENSAYDWYDDARYRYGREATQEVVDRLTFEDDDFMESEWADELRWAIEERDESNPIKDLMRNTGNQLFRGLTSDYEWFEDSDQFRTDMEARGADVDEYVKDMGYFENGWSSCYVVFSADPAVIYETCWDTDEYIIHDAQLWIGGGPMNGDGYLVPATRPIKIKREDLALDCVGFGYSVDDVYGGICLPESTIEAVKKN